MKKVKVYHYDAFSNQPEKGNPAGVVLDGDNLTEDEMQEVAFKVGFNETAFPLKSDVADIRLRFFTPGHEMDLCGHATMATVFALKSEGMLGDKTELTIETNAGILPIRMNTYEKNETFITMKQSSPQFKEFAGSREDLVGSLGLKTTDLHPELPILYGSTGTWTLLIPIKDLSAFQNMKPDNKRFPGVLKEMPKSSVHPFCLETNNVDADMHARHFSSPFSGTVEDAVTGTASGVMGAYYATYVNSDYTDTLDLTIEQGHEIDKDGQVFVEVTGTHESLNVEITGKAVYVKEFHIKIK
ncbi:PhzF family phenazine biosynthesis protein [Salimicrobium flavidum]|uniref:Phenazine biosynthesis protein PhzF family n=1 Tax=Salimicrobium flavidum TaxID=570947 RepID=A0A1N7KS88_9BACI|nr:PhzF family phenazine biosynthesis isomerase [Salimicrobium flavidum]SIS64424.1 phenazine biosynthesis protein PhzF family [Salimicrobium flavidum]